VRRSICVWVVVLAGAASLGVCAAAAADAERVVPAPTWEYQFPPGLVGFSAMRVTPDVRYLAISTGRWTRTAGGGAEAAVAEGENAVYLFDLREKRLLFKEAFPDETAVFVVGLSPSAGVVAVQSGASSAKEAVVGVRRQEGTTIVQGTRVFGPPEAGVRLYGQDGRLLAKGAPVVRSGGAWPYDGTLLLRPAAAGETAVPDDLRRTLVEAGVRPIPSLLPHSPFGFVRSREGESFVSFAEDGTEYWSWQLPPDEAHLAREWRSLTVSHDLEYALVSLTPYDGQRPSDLRHLYLFGRRGGLVWQAEASLDIPVRYGARSLGVQVADGGVSALVVRAGPRGAIADIRDRSGAISGSWEFAEMQPKAYSLSPSGRYWAAALRQTWQGPRETETTWTAGIHVFDCNTGEVVWQSPAMADAVYVMATDAGGVVAISSATRTVAVFDPPR